MEKYTYLNGAWLKILNFTSQQEEELMEIEDVAERETLEQQFSTQNSQTPTQAEIDYLNEIIVNFIPSSKAVLFHAVINNENNENKGVLIFTLDNTYKIIHF